VDSCVGEASKNKKHGYMFKSLDYYGNFYTYTALKQYVMRSSTTTLSVRAARVRQSISHACSGTTFVLCLVAIIKL
jgi:hypothetical protein